MPAFLSARLIGRICAAPTPVATQTTVPTFAILEGTPNGPRIENIGSLSTRVEKRDNIVGIIPEGESSYILTQGNEPEGVTEFAKLLNSFHALGMDVNESTTSFESFGRTESPLKKMLVNICGIIPKRQSV